MCLYYLTELHSNVYISTACIIQERKFSRFRTLTERCSYTLSTRYQCWYCVETVMFSKVFQLQITLQKCIYILQSLCKWAKTQNRLRCRPCHAYTQPTVPYPLETTTFRPTSGTKLNCYMRRFMCYRKKGKASSLDIALLTILNSGTF